MAEKHDTAEQSDTATLTRSTRAPRFKVLIHNDDYTTMDFVVLLLVRIFRHSEASAHRLMWAVHHEGVGVAGVYDREIAEMRMLQARTLAHEHGHPLLVTMEPE